MQSANAALLTVAAATVGGLGAQVFGQRLRIPAIVPLLVVGVVLGPSGLGIVNPGALGAGLSVLVKLAVAIILFDGALNLRLTDLRHAMREVRNLIAAGLVVTWIGATLAAWLIAGFSARVAIVFGALVTVTGPTVVQPILRRVHVSRRLRTILEGEAILIDPIGAILAVTVVDVILGIAGIRPLAVLGGVWGYTGRLVVGAGLGVLGAALLSVLLKRRGVIPTDLTNLVSLAAVWGVFGLAESLQRDSGIMAAVAMGLATQRGSVPDEHRLRRFKEQLTVLGISLLFVLLSANLPIALVREEGVRGLWTVAALMFVVRPAGVWLALGRSSLTWRELTFVSWIAPRGVVAASVASLFALELTEAGFVEGNRVLAVTFLTIALTVVAQGLTALPVARLLGLESLVGKRVIIVGAGPMARALAKSLVRYDRPVTLIDRNEGLVDEARQQGLEAVSGNALDESILSTAGAEEAESMIAITTNPEVNALATHLAHDAFGIARAYPVLASPARGASPRLLDRMGGHLAFGRPLDLREWEYALRHGAARTIEYAIPASAPERLRADQLPDELIPLARVRQRSIEIATERHDWRPNDILIAVTTLSEADAVRSIESTAGILSGGGRS